MGLELLIQYLFEFISLFKFWRVIPINKEGVKTTLGKNPTVLYPGFHFIVPFEIQHIETCIVTPEWISTHAIHLTTKDGKTVTVAPTIKYRIVDSVCWLYGENDAPSNLHECVRLCTSDIITEMDFADSTRRPTWTKIKNKIKDKTEGLGIEIDDFGLIDLALSRIFITSL